MRSGLRWNPSIDGPRREWTAERLQLEGRCPSYPAERLSDAFRLPHALHNAFVSSMTAMPVRHLLEKVAAGSIVGTRSGTVPHPPMAKAIPTTSLHGTTFQQRRPPQSLAAIVSFNACPAISDTTFRFAGRGSAWQASRFDHICLPQYRLHHVTYLPHTRAGTCATAHLCGFPSSRVPAPCPLAVVMDRGLLPAPAIPTLALWMERAETSVRRGQGCVEEPVTQASPHVGHGEATPPRNCAAPCRTFPKALPGACL